ncbi:D-alanine--D-alanine ligase [bacterium]|nr:MAG: D-alanine--D-alanine ligase [bacterium]
MSSAIVIVAFGGVSPEHEVSVITGIQAAMALKESGQACIPLYISKQGAWFSGEHLLELSNYKDLKVLTATSPKAAFVTDSRGVTAFEIEQKGLFKKPLQYNPQAVLCAFHGSDGENGSFQGLCEALNVPYSGSGVLASSLGMDKDMTKRVCRDAGIPVVDGLTFWESEWVCKKDTIVNGLEKFGYPLIVKPSRLGSSIGVAKADNQAQLIDSIETAFRYDSKLLVEKAIQPLREINCSVLGTAEENKASVCEQPKGSTEILSFTDKYQSDSNSTKGMASASRLIPAPISEEKTNEIQQLSKQIFSVLGCSGVARLDFLMNDETGHVYFNEINTIPGSLSFYLWEKSGFTFSQLTKELVRIAVLNHQQKNGRIRSYETNLLSEKSAKGIKGLKGLKK